MVSSTSTDCLKTYFEQQNDTEAASMVAAVIAMLPSHPQEPIDVAALETTLLIKESEIAALNEVIFKWRNRAIELEMYYQDQLDNLQRQCRSELKSMESRCHLKLQEKDDIISNLKDQVDHLVSIQCNNRCSSQEPSFIEEEEEEEDNASSVYDREAEQQWIESPKSENILNSIQDTMRAIEQELNFHALRAADNNEQEPYHSSLIGCYSSNTLVHPETKHKSKKPFMHRIMKKAFPKLCQQKRKLYKSQDVSARENTDEALAMCSADQPYQKSIPMLSMMSSLQDNAMIAT
ncbi:hypothetical protein CU098_005487 [Rhizopus stolonifer]|uniref:Uncharacterized protein n=1 Tax=Rhizopus stolonifer TaxID=4846 RepID=A0A367JTU6_RHIST|nr:hypothetical protein CU098_005487 [Rhizopus stolonifer]